MFKYHHQEKWSDNQKLNYIKLLLRSTATTAKLVENWREAVVVYYFLTLEVKRKRSKRNRDTVRYKYSYGGSWTMWRQNDMRQQQTWEIETTGTRVKRINCIGTGTWKYGKKVCRRVQRRRMCLQYAMSKNVTTGAAGKIKDGIIESKIEKSI